MTSPRSGTALASILLTLPLTALSASLPDTSSTTQEPANAVETRSFKPHLSTGLLVVAVVVPVVVFAILSTSLYLYCRRSGYGVSFGSSKIREIVSPISPTSHHRNAFYELGRKEGYESVTPLHPTLDPDSPRSSTVREPWHPGHARHDTGSSIGSAASLHLTMSGALQGSPYLGGHEQQRSGRYTPVSGRDSPGLGHSRARTHTASSVISLPIHGSVESDHRRCSSPLAWNAEQILSDGSDRVTPVPWEDRAETEGKSRSSYATLQSYRSHSRALSPEQDIASMSPYYDPHIAARRMSIPMVLSVQATPTSARSSTPPPPAHDLHDYQTISETAPWEARQHRQENVLEADTHESSNVEEDEVDNGNGEAQDNHVSRSQTLRSINSVTTIRTSVDTQFTDWQLPPVDEHEEMPQLPKERLRRSVAIRRTSTGLS